jgi:phage tail protein X
VRPRTAAEREFCCLGPVAEAFITGAAAAGSTRLGTDLAELNTLRAAHGDEVFLDALDRAVAFCRWRPAEVRSILAAGPGTADPRPAGNPLALDLPAVPVRSLADYAIGALA